MLGVRRRTPTLAIHGDTGHFPLLLKQQNMHTLKYWARLIALPDYHILKNAHNCVLGLDSIGIENWITHVKTLLFNLNLSSFWETQTIERMCRFINNVKQQTEDKCIDDWTEKISCQNQQAKLWSDWHHSDLRDYIGVDLSDIYVWRMDWHKTNRCGGSASP